MNHTYLLHLILAFSALHLVHLKPHQGSRYGVAAARHQSKGIEGMRAALAQMSQENYHALFLAGSFVVVDYFASLATRVATGAFVPRVEDIVDLFVLIKGMSSVLDIWENALNSGPLADLFRPSSDIRASPSLVKILDELKLLDVTLQAKLVDSSIASIIRVEVLRMIEDFGNAVRNAPVPGLRIMMSWPIYTTGLYIQLLKEHEPAALVVVAYYCVIIHEAESEAWFARGWSSKLVEAIGQKLPSDWKDCISWPLDQIRSDQLSVERRTG